MSEGAASILDFSSVEPAISAPEETTPTADAVETPAPDETTPESTPETPTTDATPEAEGGDAAPSAPPSLKQMREAVKAFSETSPEHANALKSLMTDAARYRAMTEAFPDVETARSTRAAIEAAGGLEGISRMQTTLDAVEETDAKLAEGDPSVLDDIIEDAKDGFVKLAPHYLNRLEKVDAAAFSQAIRPHLVRSLAGANFGPVLDGLARLVKDNPDAAEVVGSMQEWFEGQKRLAEKTNADTLEPERAKLKEGWSQIEQEKNKIFEGEVQSQVLSHVNSELGNRLKPYLQNSKLSDAMKRDVAFSCYRELGEAMKADRATVDSMMRSKSRDSGKVATYVKSRVSALADAVVKKVAKDYNLSPAGKPGPKPGQRPGNPNPAAPTGPVKVAQRPGDNDIDWDKTLNGQDVNMFYRGEAWTKNGKWVKWR